MLRLWAKLTGWVHRAGPVVIVILACAGVLVILLLVAVNVAEGLSQR